MLTKFILSASVASLLLVGCTKDDDDSNPTPKTADLTLDITGLPDLGDNYRYEGWLLNEKATSPKPVTTGTFTVNDKGVMSKTTFSIVSDTLSSATKFVLTIEPNPDNDAAPSSTHILAGEFSSNTAMLTIGDQAAIGNDFADATGQYILATPSNGADSDEKSGIWFLKPGTTLLKGLDLPRGLPDGWRYEGWVVIGDTPVSTGTFVHSDTTDSFNGYSGTMDMDTPKFPGEDFLVNAPEGLTFPTDLSGGKAVISIEPHPDNDPKPFALKPLVGSIPTDAKDHTLYDMENNISATAPTGTAKR